MNVELRWSHHLTILLVNYVILGQISGPSWIQRHRNARQAQCLIVMSLLPSTDWRISQWKILEKTVSYSLLSSQPHWASAEKTRSLSTSLSRTWHTYSVLGQKDMFLQKGICFKIWIISKCIASVHHHFKIIQQKGHYSIIERTKEKMWNVDVLGLRKSILSSFSSTKNESTKY